MERHIGRRLPVGWNDEFASLYDAAYAADLTAVEGVVPLLQELAERGIPTCVASNGSHEKMRQTLGITGLHGRFKGRIFSAQDVALGKPEPDLYLHAARTMGVPPERCVVVEDSPRGVAAALRANMSCIGFAALTPPERLAAPGVVVCGTMSQVRDELRALFTGPSVIGPAPPGGDSSRHRVESDSRRGGRGPTAAGSHSGSIVQRS